MAERKKPSGNKNLVVRARGDHEAKTPPKEVAGVLGTAEDASTDRSWEAGSHQLRLGV